MIKGFRLSNNPSTAVIETPSTVGIEGLNGKINVTSDGRQFYLIEFTDPMNPFQKSIVYTAAQNSGGPGGQAQWRIADPETIGHLKGQMVPGAIITKQVPAYEIQRSDGSTYTANTATVVVLGNESIRAAFAKENHQLPDTSQDAMAQAGLAVMQMFTMMNQQQNAIPSFAPTPTELPVTAVNPAPTGGQGNLGGAIDSPIPANAETPAMTPANPVHPQANVASANAGLETSAVPPVGTAG